MTAAEISQPRTGADKLIRVKIVVAFSERCFASLSAHVSHVQPRNLTFGEILAVAILQTIMRMHHVIHV